MYVDISVSGSQLEVLGEEKHHALDAAAGQPLGRQREPRVADLSTAVKQRTLQTVWEPWKLSHTLAVIIFIIYVVKLSRVRSPELTTLRKKQK